MVQIVRLGVTRTVVLIGGAALKFPVVRYGWKNFLHGLLCNMCEISWGRSEIRGLCPIIWYVPGGWLVVMRRCAPVPGFTSPLGLGGESDGFVVSFRDRVEEPDMTDAIVRNCDGVILPVELKDDSFGRLSDGTIVAVDYGGSLRGD